MSPGRRPRVQAAAVAGPVPQFDPVTLEIAWSRLQAVIDEGETTLMRTAFSPIIREAYDFAVVLMDVRGASAGQSRRSLGSFVGTLPRTLRAALSAYPPEAWHEGDVFSTNDPWIGTGHLPDQTMIRPVFRKGRLVAYVGCIAHWADIGGQIWSGDTTEIFEEGLRIPLRKLVDRGVLNADLAAVIRANVRLPEQVMGDLHAQLACLEVCERRLQELLDDLQLDDPTRFFMQMQARAESAMRAAIRALKDGAYRHAIEIDGVDTPLLLEASLSIRGDSIHVDWTGSSPQCERGLNETYNHAYAMTVYPIKCALSPELPNNEGAYRPISMQAPEGSIINARYPAPVASRQILGHYLSAVIFGALAQVIPDRVLADSGSPSPRVVFTGSWPDGSKYGAALILSGGMGAQSYRDGLTAAPFPSNAGAISVEMVEAATPLLFRRRALVPDSGGPGRFRGGLGVATHVELLGQRPGVISVMTDRVQHPPLGRSGGGPGRPNVITKSGRPVDPKSRTGWEPGDLLAIESAGGAGFGPVSERDPDLVRADLEEGYISLEAAVGDYGLRD
jgi:N-methylhydantoinase B